MIIVKLAGGGGEDKHERGEHTASQAGHLTVQDAGGRPIAGYAPGEFVSWRHVDTPVPAQQRTPIAEPGPSSAPPMKDPATVVQEVHDQLGTQATP